MLTSAVLTAIPTRFLTIKVKSAEFLHKDHHHSPLEAWSLSSLPFDFPLMEHFPRLPVLE